MSTNEERKKLLESAIATIEKDHGKGILMRMGDSVVEPVEVISSGSVALNIALGIGGYPRGRIIEIYGPESAGKTTLTLHAIAEAQKRGGLAAFIDAEHALDLKYAKNLGVDVDNLYLSQPSNGEQALEIVDKLVSTGSLDIVVVDSVAALTPQAEIDGEMGDAVMGMQARLMSQAMRKLTGTIHRSKTSVFFLNQMRMKIGIVFGNPETTTGGQALKFYASIRLDIRKKDATKEGEVITGHDVKVKVVKNKLAPPFRVADTSIVFGKGIDLLSEVIFMAVEKDIIQKTGSWYSYKDERIGQGEEAVKAFLSEKGDVFEEIKNKLYELNGVKPPSAVQKEEVKEETPSPRKIRKKEEHETVEVNLDT